MQAPVYSTATDVKIHKVLRREWATFQAWLSDQYGRLEYREHEILRAAQRKRGKTQMADQQILALREELLAVARGEWLARVRNKQLHLEHWVMTPDEKHSLQQTLYWTQKEMVDAYAQQQAEMGPMYQRVDPSTLGTKDSDKHLNSPSRFMHPVRCPDSIKSVELPSMPLYFVGALLQGTDLDEVVASHLETFALHASEEKIREYYAEACEASVHFQRRLATHRMQELARAKEREWKAITVKELRKHQAAEIERRAAQQRAMRPPPRKKQLPREFSDWDYLDEYYSPPREHTSPKPHHNPRREYLEAYYRSPRREYLEAHHSPRLEFAEAYHSPQPRRRKRQPVVEEDAYVGSPRSEFMEEYQSPRSRRWQPVEEEDVYALQVNTSPKDWSSVRVDEMDLKHESVSATKRSRHGLDFILRLEGTGNPPKSAHREKLRKRNTMGEHGPVFRRRVSDAEREIAMARQVRLDSGQKKEAGSFSDQISRAEYGAYRKTFQWGQIPRGAMKGRQVPLSLGHPFRRVRFSPSVVSAASVASKFHERFDSKTAA
ncbi:hypothetical protein B0H12DRAFT_1131221 [Mycena haematopus]|nr:hypothetical protein B0H12DRAFT_1131221 [Mycena haematopus]